MTDEPIKTILFLAANPTDARRLHLDMEVREIQKGLQRAGQRHQFQLEHQWAVRPQDVRRAILDVDPQIVHFLGGGARYAGLVLEDDSGREQEVAPEAIASLFSLFAEQVECVIFNACYSEIQAEAVSQHINYVIGINQGIEDKAVIEFAVGFYDALGAGKSIEFAYKFGCSAIALAGLAEHQIPILKKKAVNKTIDLRQSLENERAKDLELLKILEDQRRVETDPARRYKVELEIKEVKQRLNEREIEIKAVSNNFIYQGNISQDFWENVRVGGAVYSSLFAPQEDYEREFSDAIKQHYPLTSDAQKQLLRLQKKLRLSDEEVALIKERIEAQISINDIEEIRAAIIRQRVQDYQQLAKAIIRRMRATVPVSVESSHFDSGTAWEVLLPTIGLRLRTNKAVMFLRRDEKDSNFHEYLAEIAFEKNAAFLIVADIVDIRYPPMQVGLPTIWFRPESLIEMATMPEKELLGWLGRFITTQIDVCSLPGLLPYQITGAAKEELFFGRDYELTRLIGGTLRGGIIVGAHRSGKTSLLYQLGKRLQQQKYQVVDVLTLGGIDHFKSFFERTLEPLDIDFPGDMTSASWAEALRTYTKNKNNQSLIIFLLDEVDDLISLDTQLNFQVGKQMRSLQSDGHCKFFLAGHAKLRAAVEVEGGPFRNFAEEITLTGLTETASKRLIQQPMKLIGFEVTDKQAHRIFKGTAGVAVLIQEFCIRLLRGLRQVNTSHIEDSEIEKIEQSPEYLSIVFEHYKYSQEWDSMAVLLLTTIFGEVKKREILKEMGKRGASLTISRLDKVLDFLVRFGVLEEFKPSEYRVLPGYLCRTIMARDPELLLKSALEEGGITQVQLEVDKNEPKNSLDKLLKKVKNIFLD